MSKADTDHPETPHPPDSRWRIPTSPRQTQLADRSNTASTRNLPDWRDQRKQLPVSLSNDNAAADDQLEPRAASTSWFLCSPLSRFCIVAPRPVLGRPPFAPRSGLARNWIGSSASAERKKRGSGSDWTASGCSLLSPAASLPICARLTRLADVVMSLCLA